MNAVTALKVPPHSIEAEQAVIAAMLFRPELLSDLEVQPADLYRREHRVILETMLRMQESRREIDLLTVSDALKADGKLTEAGGLEYLSQFADLAYTASNAKHYAQLVADRATERRMIVMAHKVADLGYNGEGLSTQDKLDKAQSHIAEFMDGCMPERRDPASIDQCIRETIPVLERHWDNRGQLLGLPTGFADLDARTQGLRDGDLIIVAGRPSQGKTALAMNIAEHNALAGKLVIVFNLEMPRQALTTRMLASVGRIPHKKLEGGGLADDELDRLTSAAARLKGKPYYIVDDTTITSRQILSTARRIAHRLKMKPALVVVDYLQLLADKGKDANERLSTISRAMKLTAKELGCPLIALSQLSREVEKRGDKRPVMSDLRDSGSLEQDADQIFMLYRDEYYNENSPNQGLAEVLCRKYRNGQVGTDILSSAFLSQCRFENSSVKHITRAAGKRGGGFNYED